jgi:flagellar basal-body rod protein FlgC
MSSFDVSASGLSAQRRRLDLVAENIANAETTRTVEGGPYRRKMPIFSTALEAAGVEVLGVVEDSRPPRMEHRPGHPDANANGYVAMPNVNVLEEMVDMVSATRSYEANVTALESAKSMVKRALEIGRR